MLAYWIVKNTTNSTSESKNTQVIVPLLLLLYDYSKLVVGELCLIENSADDFTLGNLQKERTPWHCTFWRNSHRWERYSAYPDKWAPFLTSGLHFVHSLLDIYHYTNSEEDITVFIDDCDPDKVQPYKKEYYCRFIYSTFITWRRNSYIAKRNGSIKRLIYFYCMSSLRLQSAHRPSAVLILVAGYGFQIRDNIRDEEDDGMNVRELWSFSTFASIILLNIDKHCNLR